MIRMKNYQKKKKKKKGKNQLTSIYRDNYNDKLWNDTEDMGKVKIMFVDYVWLCYESTILDGKLMVHLLDHLISMISWMLLIIIINYGEKDSKYKFLAKVN